MSLRRPGTIVALVLLAGLVAEASARADFTLPALLSGTPQLQFEEADAPVLSIDGHYAVFQGVLGGVSGVYRRDLGSGEVVLAAGGDAAGPSVSADGRYIAFTTTADLDESSEPPLDRGCPEVYVRDMRPAAGAPLYTLASALDGTSRGISFAGSCSGFAVTGAQAAPGVAMSGDGRHVAFTVLSASNLVRGAGCPAATPLGECPAETEPSQVAVRDLDTDTTTLITATPQGEATPGGGAFPSTDSEQQMAGRSPVQAAQFGDQVTGSTAAISADASTVAWLGTNVPAQVPGAVDLESGGGSCGRSALGSEAEPLWRRVAGGSAALTRRLLAGAGLDFTYSYGSECINPVLWGSLLNFQTTVFFPPVLSADGNTVAVMSNAPSPASEPSYVASNESMENTDAYVVRVDDDPARAPGVTALTTTPNYAANLAATGDVKDVAISSDGSRVAFDTTRTQFAAGAPTLISPPSSYTNVSETYEADLGSGTLQRVTSTYDGSTPNGSAGLLAFSGDGQTLVFASRATNLFFGDSVPASQVYAVSATPAPDQVVPQVQGVAPVSAPPTPDWVLSATAAAQADGSVLLYAQVPGAGRLAVGALAQLASSVHARAGKARSKRAKARIAKGSKGAELLIARTVARGGASARGLSELRLRLRVAARYRSLVTARYGLYTVLHVTFVAPGHAPQVQNIPVTFHTASRKNLASTKSSKRRLAAGASKRNGSRSGAARSPGAGR